MTTGKNKHEKPLTGQNIPPANNLQYVTAIKLLLGELYNGDFDFEDGFSLPHYIVSRLAISYTQAEIYFTGSEGKTIAQYAAGIRVNKVKELLVYTPLTPESIAHKLNYSDVTALSAELLQQTGLPVEFFLSMKKQKETLALQQRIEASN